MNKNDYDYYATIGEFLNKNLSSEEDPFAKLKSNTRSRYRRMGNMMERRPAPKINYDENEVNADEAAVSEIKLVPVPKDLVEDFAVLQVLPGSPLPICKNSWRRLLKKFHPDTVTTKKSISVDEAAHVVRRINNAYKRILHWFESGEILNLH